MTGDTETLIVAAVDGAEEIQDPAADEARKWDTRSGR